jgi:predicted transcriptional regulator
MITKPKDKGNILDIDRPQMTPLQRVVYLDGARTLPANALCEIRAHLGKSEEEMADLLGVSMHEVQILESTTPRLDTIQEYLNLLHAAASIRIQFKHEFTLEIVLTQ